jgi:DNA-binding Xre family transcriptional regulator
MTNIESESPALSEAAEIGANIHQLMWRKRVTQQDAGRAIGVTQATMSRKIRGAVPITAVELMKIARLLDVEPGDLLTLPRLDSNQQPSGYLFTQVRPHPCVVVDLSVRRSERARRAS